MDIVTPTSIKQLNPVILAAYITATNDLLLATGLINNIEIVINSIRKLVKSRGVECPINDNRYIEAIYDESSPFRVGGWNVKLYGYLDANSLKFWY